MKLRGVVPQRMNTVEGALRLPCDDSWPERSWWIRYSHQPKIGSISRFAASTTMSGSVVMTSIGGRSSGVHAFPAQNHNAVCQGVRLSPKISRIVLIAGNGSPSVGEN